MRKIYEKPVPGLIIGTRELIQMTGEVRGTQKLWESKCIRCESVCTPTTLQHIRNAMSCRNCWHIHNTGSSHGSWLGYKEISGKYLGETLRGAQKRGLEYTVTAEYLWNLYEQQDKKCAYTGWNISHGKKGYDEATASIDRIDSSCGYVEGNVQWVHKDINRLKSNLTEDRFLELCLAVASKRQTELLDK